MSKSPLRVCYFGTYRASYSRNRIMMAGLRQNGVEVVECHEALWHGIEDRVNTVSGGWKKPRFWGRIVQTYARLLRRYWQLGGNYDVLVVGYPGQLDVFLARLLSWIHRKPLAWDIFMSIYLIAVERGLARSSRLAVRLLRGLEWLACRLPDGLILDTAEYAAWFERIHGVAAAGFHLVPTGADSTQFHSLPLPPESAPFTVIYYGTFIPNHGVPTMLEAARLLADQPIHFIFIGDGPDRAVAESMAQGLLNVTFLGWQTPAQIQQQVAQAHVVLGVFGTTPQSLMTVQNKIYEGLAMGRPVLTGDGPAVANALTHGEHLYLCERANSQALAAGISMLMNNVDLRQHLAAAGRAYFEMGYTVPQLGKRFNAILKAVLSKCHLSKCHSL